MIRFMLFLQLVFIVFPSSAAIKTTNGSGAIIRTLDRVTGTVEDYEIENGSIILRSKLRILLQECRYPVDDLDSDAFAHFIIHDIREKIPLFQGWMVASSPALSALEHPRYDVWVLKCLDKNILR